MIAKGIHQYPNSMRAFGTIALVAIGRIGQQGAREKLGCVHGLGEGREVVAGHGGFRGELYAMYSKRCNTAGICSEATVPSSAADCAEELPRICHGGSRPNCGDSPC